MVNRKRDKTFINLFINVCLPDLDEAALLQLIGNLYRLQDTTTEVSGDSGLQALSTEAPWDAGLLPEVGLGQEGECCI